MASQKRKSKKEVALSKPMEAPVPDDDYKVRSAYDDIMRAEVHKQDPDLMQKVHRHAKKHMKAAIKTVDDIKQYKNNKYGANGFVDEDEDGE